MFDRTGGSAETACRPLPDDDLDGVLERLLADADTPPEWVPDVLPAEWTPGSPEEPAPGLGTCAPSGWLALDLDSATPDPAGLSDATLVEAMTGFDRLASWAQARQARLLAELARRRPTDQAPHSARWACVGSEYAADEIGVALTLSRGSACARLGLACRLLTTLPETHALWEAGQIDAADGMASLWALLTATQAAGAYTWLTRLARGLGATDPRSMDTRRADILAALLSGQLQFDADTPSAGDAPPAGTGSRDTDSTGTDDAAPGAAVCGGAAPDTTGSLDAAATGPRRPIHPVTPAKPLLQIVLGHSTLTGADDHPAELVGHGPIPASLARETAADSVWRRLITDPWSGTLLDHGRTTYHPPAGLANHVRARDVHCRFPGCRRTAADAELDHVIAWSDGGTTSEPNLAACCTHHHRVKTYAEWRVEARPGGRLTWITPTGHRHTTEPHDYRPPTWTVSPEPEAPPAPDGADPDPPPF